MNADEQERIMKQNDKDYGDWVCVVRCKDCKYSSYDDSYLSIPICEKLGIYADNDFFCKYGERKGTE